MKTKQCIKKRANVGSFLFWWGYGCILSGKLVKPTGNSVAQRLVDEFLGVVFDGSKNNKFCHFPLKKHKFCDKIIKKQPLVDKMKCKVGGVEMPVAYIM